MKKVMKNDTTYRKGQRKRRLKEEPGKGKERERKRKKRQCLTRTIFDAKSYRYVIAMSTNKVMVVKH
jgi:hypothetical protein